MARVRNDRLDMLLKEADWSQTQAAAAFNQVIDARGLAASKHIGRSHISMWVGGTTPAEQARVILCEALSRQLHRTITPAELGYASPGEQAQDALEWSVDPLVTLADLGRADLDAERRTLLTGATYSAISLGLDQTWWTTMAQAATSRRPASPQHVGRGDVAAVRELTAVFSRLDQQHGGGHGRRALVQYLRTDVAAFLNGTFSNDHVRREMFAAAGAQAYLAGWMAFDNNEHAIAQRYYVLALKLAAQADDRALSGHILRAMAHQALDLGAHNQALDLADASLASGRYAAATPRERALLGVIHARALASCRRPLAATRALLRAEDNLAAARAGDGEEPDRTHFFGEAALAHETACTLRDINDRAGAVQAFRRSVDLRGSAFRRTHAITMGYLGATQIKDGHVEEACATWSGALDILQDGVHSGRARNTVVQMRSLLGTYRKRGVPRAAAIEDRARKYLARVE